MTAVLTLSPIRWKPGERFLVVGQRFFGISQLVLHRRNHVQAAGNAFFQSQLLSDLKRFVKVLQRLLRLVQVKVGGSHLLFDRSLRLFVAELRRQTVRRVQKLQASLRIARLDSPPCH